MATRYILQFVIENLPAGLSIEVREMDASRLEKILYDDLAIASRPEFFSCHTVDGKKFAIRLEDVQVVRYLRDAADFPPDTVFNQGPTLIQLRGRDGPLEEYSSNSTELAELFSNLELGSDVVAFPSFTDMDGEILQLNARQIVWISASAAQVDDGYRSIAVEDGLVDSE